MAGRKNLAFVNTFYIDGVKAKDILVLACRIGLSEHQDRKHRFLFQDAHQVRHPKQFFFGGISSDGAGFGFDFF